MNFRLHFTLLLLAATFAAGAQNTIGLLSYKPAQTFEGYNLIYPHSQANVYLLNNCGEVVHTWTDDAQWRPGNSAFLHTDGTLFKAKRLASIAGNPIWAGGGGAIIEQRDWDNNLLWSYELNDTLYRLHHDFTRMPNGHILAIAWERKTQQEAVDAGRDPAKIATGAIWPDMIIEIDPATNNIVWEWHVWDHIIQDFDATKANFGPVGDHPELIDLNYDTNAGQPSWLHTNAIDYDPINDMILLSTPYFDEVWIIDHSTTTAQAAGHTGGLGGRGGDLLYRWGNASTYRNNDPANHLLRFQHNVHWVRDFLDPTNPYYGKIAVFNNRAGADYSTANVFTPNFDMYEWEFPMQNGVWGPTAFDLTVQHPVPTKMYSTGLSSFQILPNGNYLLLAARNGYAFEMTPQNEIVWEYIVPLDNGVPATQGNNIPANNNTTWRMKRYPVDFSAFDGKDLSAKGWIEQNPDSTFCAALDTRNPLSDAGLRLSPNPAGNYLNLEWEGGAPIDVEIFDARGMLVMQQHALTNGFARLHTAALAPGFYWLRSSDGKSVRWVKQ